MEREGSIRNAVVTVSKNRDITARKMWYRDHFLIGKDAIHLRNENSDILPGARSCPTYEYIPFEYDFRTFLRDCVYPRALGGHLLFRNFCSLILLASIARG